MRTQSIILSKELESLLDLDLLKEIQESSTKDELIEKLLQKIVSPKKVLLLKEDILKMFSIPKQRFEHLVRENKIPHIYINNKIRLFNPDEVFEYLNTNCKIAS